MSPVLDISRDRLTLSFSILLAWSLLALICHELRLASPMYLCLVAFGFQLSTCWARLAIYLRLLKEVKP